MTAGCDSSVHIYKPFPYGFTDTFSTVTVMITNVPKASNPLPRASLGISAPLSERGHTQRASPPLSQRTVPDDAQPQRPRNDGPPSVCPLPLRPSPRPELSHFTLGNNREKLPPPLLPFTQPLGLGFPRLGATLPLGQTPQSPGAQASAAAASCRGSAQVRSRLTKLQACGSLKQIILRKLLLSNS